MKKILALLIALIFIICLGCGCNKQIFDVTYTFDYAVIQLPNGDVVEGNVSSWKDYDDGDQIQVVIDGVTYLVHSSNIALMNK